VQQPRDLVPGKVILVLIPFGNQEFCCANAKIKLNRREPSHQIVVNSLSLSSGGYFDPLIRGQIMEGFDREITKPNWGLEESLVLPIAFGE